MVLLPKVAKVSSKYDAQDIRMTLQYMSHSMNIGKWYVHAFAMALMQNFQRDSLIFYLFCVELDNIHMPRYNFD